MILAGDIGGTKTVIALFDPEQSLTRPAREATYPSRGAGSFDEILARFVDEEAGGATVDAACFGVAGPVAGDRVETTNLPWILEAGALARRLGLARVGLMNDLAAAGYGMLFLEDGDRVTLASGDGAAGDGNVAVIAAGTGLGEAYLVWDGERHHALATEGGHADFAPRTDREIGLLRWLRQRLGGRVSYERVLSGPGIMNVYRYLREESGTPEPGWLTERLAQDDPSAAVTGAGLEGEDPVCVDALDLFVTLYGAEAGNMALRGLALGGVFVGGGIAPKIRPALETGRFMAAFLDKGRFSDLVARIPVHLSCEIRAPLIGCAHAALNE